MRYSGVLQYFPDLINPLFVFDFWSIGCPSCVTLKLWTRQGLGVFVCLALNHDTN